MRFRRLTGLLLALLMLHLNLQGADFACAKHAEANGQNAHAMVISAEESNAGATHMHASFENEAMQIGAELPPTPAAPSKAAAAQSTDDQPPCEAPAQTNCCRALASCTVVFSAGSELDVANGLRLQHVITPGAMNVPPSERPAPEPPPPKA